jgi:signal peptidase I
MSVTSGAKRKEGGVGEFIRLLVHAGIIALVIRTFLFQPFNIPSGSMKATLLVGDYLFVSKYSYGYSHFSLPLSPHLFSGRIGDFAKPDRGDIVVFRLPKEDSTDYIKRVIGLPGDTVACCDAQGRVMVNGVGIDEPYIYVDPGQTDANKTFTAVKVPAGKVWVMGDHRNASQDSRFVGPVPENDVIGRAFAIIWPPSRWKLLSTPTYHGVPASLAGGSPMVLAAGTVAAAAALRRRRYRVRSSSGTASAAAKR